MPPLRVEVYNDQYDAWLPAMQITPGDPYGSISDNTAHGRDVYFFGVDMLENKAVIKKSVLGIDIEKGDVRSISALGGVTLVAALAPGEQYEMTVKTDKSPEPRSLRFTHLTD